jgi:hypothetical protein
MTRDVPVGGRTLRFPTLTTAALRWRSFTSPRERRVLAVYRESDHDLHPLLMDVEQPPARMITEIPAAECVSQHKDDYRAVRSLALPKPPGALVEVVGVGFFRLPPPSARRRGERD